MNDFRNVLSLGVPDLSAAPLDPQALSVFFTAPPNETTYWRDSDGTKMMAIAIVFDKHMTIRDPVFRPASELATEADG